MSARQKILRYGLSSQKKFSQSLAQKILYKKGFVMNERNSKCLFPHNKKESMKHWITKAIVFKILFDKRRNVGSEIEVGNGIADIFDADTKIVYEIENNSSKRKVENKIFNFSEASDVFIINPKEIPNDINSAKKYLERIVV